MTTLTDERIDVSKLKIITMICCVMGIALIGYWGFYDQPIPSLSTMLSIFFQSSHPVGFVDGVGISPKAIFQMDWTHGMMFIIYIVMVLDFRADIFIKCFLALLGLSSAQFIQNAWTMMNKDQFLREQLSRAWQVTYEQDPRTLEQIEMQRHCRGFYHSEDRFIHSSNDDRTVLQQGCYPIVASQFGNVIYRWAILLLFIKCVQVLCGLICYGVYIQYGRSQKDENDNIDDDHDLLRASKISTV